MPDTRETTTPTTDHVSDAGEMVELQTTVNLPRGGLRVTADRDMPEGLAVALDAFGRPIGAFRVPGGQCPPDAWEVVLSIEDYGLLLRAAAGAAHG